MFERLRQPVFSKRPSGASEPTEDEATSTGLAPPGGPPALAPETQPGDARADQQLASSQASDEAVEPPAAARRQRRTRGARPALGGPGRDATIVGLAIEPGLLVAAKSHLNGRVVVERAAFAPIGIDVVRDGEVNDVPALVEALAELFRSSKLDRRVRIGIANQRIMMRRLELPPLTDPGEIEQAVRFQAQDEIPMPLDSVVLDHFALGLDQGPSGQRLQVLLVAARRDMVERVLQAARLAGLQPDGVDLAAFGMIRALRPANAGSTENILYLSIGGLTNLAIGRGRICEFTRVIPWGVEQIAGDVAARCGVPLDDARRLLVQSGGPLLPEPAPAQASAPGEPVAEFPSPEQPFTAPATLESPLSAVPPPDVGAAGFGAFSPASTTPSAEPTSLMAGPPPPEVDTEQVIRTALGDGIRRIASEVRHSLDFYLAGQSDNPVTRALLCGPALEIRGFAEGLARELGITVVRGEVALASPGAAGNVPLSILPVAAGLSVPEGPA
jgi:type IV pilus assembly protein PilM